MPRLDAAVDHETPLVDRAEPDLVITLAVAHEMAARFHQ
jgi:hypothetical protein